MSPQDFTNAKASYDMLITTVSEPSATNRTVVVWIQHTDLVFGRGMQGVPGALEPREIPQTGWGTDTLSCAKVFVGGAGANARWDF